MASPTRTAPADSPTYTLDPIADLLRLYAVLDDRMVEDRKARNASEESSPGWFRLDGSQRAYRHTKSLVLDLLSVYEADRDREAADHETLTAAWEAHPSLGDRDPIEEADRIIAQAAASGELQEAMGRMYARHEEDARSARSLGAPECGRRADPRAYGETFTDPVCHEPTGHSGCHVGLDRAGSRSGFHRSLPALPVEETVQEVEAGPSFSACGDRVFVTVEGPASPAVKALTSALVLAGETIVKGLGL